MVRALRAAAIAVVLVATTAACQMDIDLETTVHRDGSGVFSLRFEADRELVDIAKNLAEDPFRTLGEIPEELKRKGWSVRRTTENGGLRISVERPFANAADLNAALDELARGSAQQEGPTTRFFRLKLGRSSSFLRSRTSVEGTIDLSVEGLLAESSLSAENRRILKTQLEQIGGQFFRFNLRAVLPGDVSSTRGDPDQVEGGRVTWSPELGKRTTFAATTSAYSTTALAALGIPVLLAVMVIVGVIVRRRSA